METEEKGWNRPICGHTVAETRPAGPQIPTFLLQTLCSCPRRRPKIKWTLAVWGPRGSPPPPCQSRPGALHIKVMKAVGLTESRQAGESYLDKPAGCSLGTCPGNSPDLPAPQPAVWPTKGPTCSLSNREEEEEPTSESSSPTHLSPTLGTSTHTVPAITGSWGQRWTQPQNRKHLKESLLLLSLLAKLTPLKPTFGNHFVWLT